MSQEKQKQQKADINNFFPRELIGQGAFGTVYKAIYKNNNKTYAIKEIDKKKIRQQNMESQLKNEIEIMYKIDHKHIIKLYKVLDDEAHIYLILEFAKNGQLYQRMNKKGRLDETTTKKMIREMISALEYLHTRSPPIIHRDIKPENILLDEEDHIKLADFGWSNFSGQQRKTYCGTYDYLAPEMIMKTGHDEKLDIWCLGVLVFQMLAGRPPFSGSGSNDVKRLQENILGIKIAFPEDFPVLAKDFIMSTLKKNPKQRSSLKQLENHQWMKMQPTNKLERIPSQNLKTFDSVNGGNDQNDKRIIEQLNKKNRQLQQQLNNLKINEQLKSNTEELLSIGNQDARKLKLAEEMIEKYKKQNSRLMTQLQQRNKQLTKLRQETKSLDQFRKNTERYKMQRNKIQQAYDKLQNVYDQLQKKMLDSSQKYESQKLEYEMKLKELKYRNPTDKPIDSPEFVAQLQNSIGDLVKKFNESKKILNEISRKQSVQTEAEKQLQKLRFQQNTLRQEIRMELKEQYEQQMDDIIVKAREQLNQERERWNQQRQQLSNFQRSSTMDSDSPMLHGVREQETEAELKMLRELNVMLERRVKEQENRLRDLQDMLKRKK